VTSSSSLIPAFKDTLCFCPVSLMPLGCPIAAKERDLWCSICAIAGAGTVLSCAKASPINPMLVKKRTNINLYIFSFEIELRRGRLFEPFLPRSVLILVH
jgi:hypothetical protein